MPAKKVAVIGFGNIGTGVVRALWERGIPGVELVKIVDVDLDRKRPVNPPRSLLTSDWHAVVDDPGIDIIVETIGGLKPAGDIQMAALRAGKDVVTANKKLLSNKGQEIFGLAAQLHRKIGFRASFVGCHSLIHEFQQAGTAAKKFKRIYAILNGTSNYILSTMTHDKKEFSEALKEAQAKGYAEPDPSDDIEGRDTESKIRILLSLITNSYHTAPPFYVEGVKEVTKQDIQYAGEMKYAIKLVGAIEARGDGFNVSVCPALVPDNSLLGTLEGPYNGTELEDEFGVMSGLVAPGAGVYPTTDAIVKDIMDMVNDRPLPMPSSEKPIKILPMETAERRFYLRFTVADEAGVLAQITNIFGKHKISIAGVIQKESAAKDFVPLVITTYTTREGDLLAAVKEADNLKVVSAPTKVIRILTGESL